MQIETIPELSLCSDDDAAIGQLLDLAFTALGDDGYHGRSFYKQRHHQRIIARKEGQIIGHIALLFREIRIGVRRTPIIGLAEVGTHPDYQGQGVASKLLKETMRQSGQSLAQFIVLFGTHPIYARHGFVHMQNVLRYVVMDDCQTHRIITRVDDALAVLPLSNVIWDPAAEVDLLGHLF